MNSAKRDLVYSIVVIILATLAMILAATSCSSVCKQRTNPVYPTDTTARLDTVTEICH